ncbi:lipopolysaccharide biosynthesis protein [Oryzobacter telluris]|uniref:lipopolysaccharide biosynthesis protein n=1 Tax=Oryzobacter telluris TaxID=3149179 RepID=UPI00370D2E17
MGRKRMTISLTANIVSYGTSALVALVLTPFLVTRVGKEAYSFYPLANNFILYIGILGIALNSMAARFVTVAVVRGDTREANAYFSSIFKVNLALALALVPVSTLFVANLQHILTVPPNALNEVRILFGLVLLAALIRIGASTLGIATFASDRLDLRAATDIALSGVRVVAYLALFSILPPSIIYVGVVAAAVEVASLAMNWALTRKLLPRITYFSAPFSLGAVRAVVTPGMWNAVRQVGAIMLSSLALLMCNVFLGPRATGDFAIALTVPTFVAGLVAAVGAVFVPATTYRFALGVGPELVHEVQRAQKISGIISSVVIGIYVAVALDFFRLWVPSEDEELLRALSILCVVHLVFTGATWPVSNLNISMNRVRVPALAMIVAGAVSVGLAFATLRFTDWGLVGLAASSLVPNLFLVLAFVPLYPCKELSLPRATFYPGIGVALLSFSLVFGCALALKSVVAPTSWLGLAAVSLSAGCIGLLLSAMVAFGPKVIGEAARSIGARASGSGRLGT